VNNIFLSPALFFLVWFGPIFTANLLERFSDGYIPVYNLFLFLFFLCSFACLWLAKKVSFGGKRYLFLLVLFYAVSLWSDISEIKLLLLLLWYSISVYLISIINRRLIWNQYFLVAKALSIITILEFLLWIIFGDIFFTSRLSNGAWGVPRLAPLNNEMFQHVVFLAPAFFYSLKEKQTTPLLFIAAALILSQSTGGLILIVIIACVVYFRNLKAVVAIFLIASILVSYNGFISDKLSDLSQLEQLHKVEADSNIYHLNYSILAMRKMNFTDLMLGVGYFNVDKFSYTMMGYKGSPVGASRVIMGLGVPLSLLILFLYISSGLKYANRFIFMIVSYCVFISMIKQPWDLNDFLHIFFISGLAWSLPRGIQSVKVR
jgi:hypothetical protein